MILKPISRRMVLAAGGTSTALILAGGVWRISRTPQTATLPWQLSTADPDIRLDAFRHAILAPNPHNRQPWLIRLTGEDGAFISCDLNKRLPETDPFDRQIVIGFGTFLELARIAAAERGYRMEIDAFPEGADGDRLDTRPVAAVQFIRDEGTEPEPLFAAIFMRRSNKGLYDAQRAVSPAAIAALQHEQATLSTDNEHLNAARAIIVDALDVELLTPNAHQESVRLLRIGRAEIDAAPDGIALSGPLIEGLSAVGMLDREAMTDPQSTAFRQARDQLVATYGSVPALLSIVTETNSRYDQLEAGRRYVRANLLATMLGLAVHPVSQSLQEYAAMAPHFLRIHQLLNATGHQRVQMLARIGYADPVGPSPRWPLESHLRS